ncbi:MAG: hypothetical protein V7607_642, partial [Solirubrobacteraceae bacterium]
MRRALALGAAVALLSAAPAAAH